MSPGGSCNAPKPPADSRVTPRELATTLSEYGFALALAPSHGAIVRQEEASSQSTSVESLDPSAIVDVLKAQLQDVGSRWSGPSARVELRTRTKQLAASPTIQDAVGSLWGTGHVLVGVPIDAKIVHVSEPPDPWVELSSLQAA